MKTDKQIISFGKKIFTEEIAALQKVKRSININFAKAINAINNTKGNVVFCGVGKSKLILEKTSGTFSSLGISNYVLDANQASHGSLGNLQKNDTLIIASNSGNTNELVSIIKYAKKYKIKIIGITSGAKSQLANNSEIKIIYPKVKEAGDKNFSLVPTSSTSILTCFGDALALTIGKKRNFKISKFGEHHPHGSIGKALTTIKDLTIPQKKIPYINKEAKFSKILSSISSKRFGCVLVKDKNKISIITDGDTARAANKFKSLDNLKAFNIMTKNPTLVDENTLVPDALKIMNKKRINVLLVKSKGKFKGLVSLHSVIEYLNK